MSDGAKYTRSSRWRVGVKPPFDVVRANHGSVLRHETSPEDHRRMVRKLRESQASLKFSRRDEGDYAKDFIFRTVRTSVAARHPDPQLSPKDDYINDQTDTIETGYAGLLVNSIEPALKSGYTRAMDSTLDIYTDHFGLKKRPFSLVPDPNYLYWSASHRRAYTMLEYGILTSAPITLITGEVGAGKTTLLQHLLKNLDDGVKVGLVSNAHGSRGELLQWVLMSLDQPAPQEASYVSLFDSFQKYLIKEYAEGNRVILIFDEAQNLSRESLEELRMFTNINSNSDVLLQLVLVGQPELRDIVRRPDLRQFAQRVAASFHLDAMDATTVNAYIGHRLRLSGAERNLFSEVASNLIYEATGGVPRLVNQLCDLSMVYAFTKNQKTVTLATVRQVLDDGAFFGAGAFGHGEETTQ